MIHGRFTTPACPANLPTDTNHENRYFLPTMKINNPPHLPEAVKKLLQGEGVGRDIEKVLQRYLFMFSTHKEKL